MKSPYASKKQVVYIEQSVKLGTCGDCSKLKTTCPVQQYSDSFFKKFKKTLCSHTQKSDCGQRSDYQFCSLTFNS